MACGALSHRATQHPAMNGVWGFRGEIPRLRAASRRFARNDKEAASPRRLAPTAARCTVLVLDLPLAGRRGSERFEDEGEIEDEGSRDGFLQMRGHAVAAAALWKRGKVGYNAASEAAFRSRTGDEDRAARRLI